MKLILAIAALALAGCAAPRTPHFENAGVIRDFTFPWSHAPAPRTEFRASVVGERLHFSFDCDDRDLVIAKKWRGESTLDGEDRVEMFFARDVALARYFCIEIDPLGRVHDYTASHYRKFDSAWNCPGLRTSAHRTTDGYRVDASLPLTALATVLGKPVRSGDTVLAGLFRAEFYGHEKRTHGEADDNWLSWVQPTPMTPDFHVPSAFARLKLP